MPDKATIRAIKKASKKARSQLKTLDDKMRKELISIYKDSAAQFEQSILLYAEADGSLGLSSLNATLDAVHQELNRLSSKRGDLLETGFYEAVSSGSSPFSSLIGFASVATINRDAVQYVQSFLANDGLQLSDRIWRIDNGAREAVSKVIQQAVIQGQSASSAAHELLQKGERVPASLLKKMNVSQADKVAQKVKTALLTGEGSPLANAKRVFRAELNRAHGEAYQAAAFAHPDVVGTRFLLSPNHKKPDICDMHANVNRYGLGRGVYPDGKNPWPAHPNTISFVEVVFSNEVSGSDREGKESRIQWLHKQEPGVQSSVLGKNKAAAFRAGHIEKERDISESWKTIKVRLERKGIDTRFTA